MSLVPAARLCGQRILAMLTPRPDGATTNSGQNGRQKAPDSDNDLSFRMAVTLERFPSS
jgi:hypothetical protein